MNDWCDTETQDYLNEWVGKTISAVEPTKADDGTTALRLHFRGGRVVQIVTDAFGALDWTVEDVE